MKKLLLTILALLAFSFATGAIYDTATDLPWDSLVILWDTIPDTTNVPDTFYIASADSTYTIVVPDTMVGKNTYLTYAVKYAGSSRWFESVEHWWEGRPSHITGGLSIPAAAMGSYVNPYINIADIQVDTTTGNIKPRTDITLFLNLICERNSIYNGSYLIAPGTYSGIPDSNGQVVFHVPPTTLITPAGAYYELSFARGIFSRSGDMIKRFILDTTPDPINIINATEVP